MKMKHVALGAVALAALLVSQLSMSASASACGHGYKKMKHRSGNTVCVIDAQGGNNAFKAAARRK